MPHQCCCLDTSASLVSGLCQLALEIGLKAAAHPECQPPVTENLASLAEAMNRVAEQIHATHELAAHLAQRPASVPAVKVEGWLHGV